MKAIFIAAVVLDLVLLAVLVIRARVIQEQRWRAERSARLVQEERRRQERLAHQREADRVRRIRASNKKAFQTYGLDEGT